jgi:glycosyltransferase involved in cell wall biosynthesis
MSWTMRLSIPMALCADVVVTVCEDSRRLLANLFPWRAKRIICIPNGLPGAARPAPADEALLADLGLTRGRFFLCAGRLVPQKRVELIVQALAASGSRCSLIVAGVGSHSAAYVTMLKEEVRRCRVADRVHFVGQLDWEQLLCLYTNCRAVVHPSDHEGCSNTILEAIECHACVVCTDLPENRALLGDAGLYVAHGDVDGLAATLCALERETIAAERQGMIVAQQRRLRSWDDIAVEFHRIYWPRQIDRSRTAPQPASALARTRSDAA